jgi:hypothetical protein
MNFHALERHNSRLVGANCYVFGIQIRRDSYSLRRNEGPHHHGEFYLVSYLAGQDLASLLEDEVPVIVSRVSTQILQLRS